MKLFMVEYNDNDCLQIAMGQDSDCDGAICSRPSEYPVALFADKASARLAIRISEANARLRREQGKPANDDFLPQNRKCVRIVPCVVVDGRAGA